MGIAETVWWLSSYITEAEDALNLLSSTRSNLDRSIAYATSANETLGGHSDTLTSVISRTLAARHTVNTEMTALMEAINAVAELKETLTS
jgi:hypothetical protein